MEAQVGASSQGERPGVQNGVSLIQVLIRRALDREEAVISNALAKAYREKFPPRLVVEAVPVANEGHTVSSTESLGV